MYMKCLCVEMSRVYEKPAHPRVKTRRFYRNIFYVRRILPLIKRKDRFPRIRRLILILAQLWVNILALKAALWGIESTVAAHLRDLFVAARDAFDAAGPTERTSALTARVNAAFDALEAYMRDIKDRYFKTPPLLDEDFIALGLKPKDDVMTVVPRPTSHPPLLSSYKGYNTVAPDIMVMLGENPPLDCHVEVFRGIFSKPHGGAAP